MIAVKLFPGTLRGIEQWRCSRRLLQETCRAPPVGGVAISVSYITTFQTAPALEFSLSLSFSTFLSRINTFDTLQSRASTMADFHLPTFSTPEHVSKKRLGGPVHAERHVKIICVGAGASGLLLAYKLQRHFDNYSLTVYEKNAEVSGTWFENKYPG